MQEVIGDHRITPLMRIDDKRFAYVNEKSRQPVIFEINGEAVTTRLAYLLAKKAQKIIIQKEGLLDEVATDFVIGERYWKLYPKETCHSFVSSLLDKVHKVHLDEHSNMYKIEEIPGWKRWWNGAPKYEEKRFEFSSYNNHFTMKKNPETGEFLIREKYTAKPFTDPFTKLAKVAFQQYETKFRNPDNFRPHDSDYRIVMDGHLFKLVPKEHPLANEKEAVRFTVDIYRSFMEEKFGKEKVQQIAWRFGFDFDEMMKKALPLTPEHVYRLNIGVSDIETHDLNRLLLHLTELLSFCEELDEDDRLDIFFDGVSSDHITGREKQSLFRILQEEEPKVLRVKDFIEWVQEITNDGEVTNISDLSVDYMNKLMELYILDAKALDRSLTGRKIYGLIKSYYSIAETGEYKPWVDMQELQQTFSQFIGTDHVDFFLEKMVHVVSKKNLIRREPDGEYHVGLLIPAPVDENKRQRWYKVSSCVSYPSGIHYYTLESACRDKSLEGLVLFRSTATDPHNLRANESVFNDLSGLNSPGYGYIDEYILPFIIKHTLVLYEVHFFQAKKHFHNIDPFNEEDREMEYAIDHATKAVEEFDRYMTKDYRPKSFKQILRNYDTIINEVYRLAHAESLKNWSLSSTFQIYPALVEFVYTKIVGEEEKKNEKELAEELHSKISEFAEKETKTIRLKAMEALLNELEENILVEDQSSFNEKIMQVREKYRPLTDKIELLSREKVVCNKQKILLDLLDLLEKYVLDIDEDLSEKEERNIIFAGHSLGGAAAQTHIVRYFVDYGRVPFPKHYCMGYFVDDPAINDEDNEKFKEWGIKHKSLFRKMDIQFRIKRRQEAGDIVPLGGEVHLGATCSVQEANEVEEFVSVDAEVRKRLKTAIEPEIVGSAVAHETQFEKGVPCDKVVEGGDYARFSYGTYIQGLFDFRGRFQSKKNPETGSFERFEVEEEESKAQWQLMRLFWDLSDLHNLFEGEKIRTNPYVSLIYHLLMVSDEEDPLSEYVDEVGIFAVTEEGVISKKSK